MKREEKLLLYGQVKSAKSFCYLGKRLNISGTSEAVMTARTRIGRVKLQECGEWLSLKMKKEFVRVV